MTVRPAAAKPQSKKASISAKWSVQKDGSLTLTFPSQFAKALAEGELIVSGSGKSASPVNITAMPLDVDREEGAVQFKVLMNVYAPVGAGEESFKL